MNTPDVRTYSRFAACKNGADPAEPQGLSHWRSELAGAPAVLELRTDKPRPGSIDWHGAIEPLFLSPELLESLKSLSQKEQTTLHMTLAAGFMALLHRYTDQDDILAGTRLSGNTVVLRAEFTEGLDFRCLLQQVGARVTAAQAHQDVPLEQLIAELAPERAPGCAPLIQVMFVLEDSEEDAREEETTGFDLTLSLAETSEGLDGSIEYNADLFEPETIRRMAGHFQTLLTAASQDPGRQIAALALLPEAERRQLLEDWNDTTVSYPNRNDCLHQLFEAQAARTPDSCALVFEEDRLTYRELNRRANRLATQLRELGAREESPVAICVDRSIEMIVAILGILKAGAAYVPIDPAFPEDRIAFMLADAGVRVLVTQTGSLARIPPGAAQAVCLDCFAWDGAEDLVQSQPAADSLAYVIYTSGSTGQSKGVCIEHRNIVNYVLGVTERLGLEPGMNCATVSTIAADLGNTVVFPALVTGACLHVISQARAENQALLSDYFVREHIDVLKIVPSHLAALQTGRNPERVMPAARLVLGGEASRLDFVEGVRLLSPDCRIYNHYGPTETTVGVLTYAVGSQLPMTPSGTLPLGRPLPNSRVYILDGQGQPSPAGLPGELCIGGRGVARGYLNRPALTAERFVPDPFSPEADGRMYRTGDRARYLADGNIEFLGRIDQQVKIHGYRIEPGEIEASLRQVPGVGDAVVVAREDEPGNKQLVAYVVPERADQPLWDYKTLHVLPDGSPVAHLNKNETDYIYQEIFVLQAYIRHGITIRDGDCVLDAGSNIGMFAVFANRLARDLRTVCFEPNPSAFECLQANTRAWGANVTCMPFGLSREETTADMTFFEGFSLLSGFYADEATEREVVKNYALNQTDSQANEEMAAEIGELLADRFHAQSVKARLRTISHVMAEEGIDRVDLLKVNVEKSELAVLQGISAVDWPKIRQLVIEVDQSSSVEPITALLEQHGYEVLVEQDPLLRKTDLCYVYAIRPSAAGSLIREQLADEHVRTLPAAGTVLAPAALRKFLNTRLPHYMVPAAFVRMEKLPLTPNGKIDRRALPAPSGGTGATVQEFVAPRSQAEKSLANIWRDVLKLERIGIHDNFFELGGHSLTAIRAVAQIRDVFDVELPTRTLFTHATIAALAEALGKLEARPSAPAELVQVKADPANRHRPFPLNYIQQAYLIGRSDGVELGNIPCRPYNEFDVLDWDQERFETALDRMIERHEMLRSIVLPEGEQQILENVPKYKIQTGDLRKLDAATAAARIESIRQEMILNVPPTEAWPLFEIRASRLDDRHTRLHITIDLLIADGRSFEIFFTELAEFYRDPELVLPPLDLSFRDYLSALNVTEQTAAFRESQKYWMERLPSLPPAPDIPLATNPAAIEKPIFKRRSARIDAGTWRNLREKGTRFQATPSGILLAAYAEVLAIWSKSARFTLNLALFNRLPLHPQANEIIGDFTSVNLLMVDNTTPESFHRRVQRQQEQLWEDLDHRLFSGIHVMRELRRLQGVGPKALMPIVFTSLLNLDDGGEGTKWLSRLGEPGFAHTQTPQVYLDFIVQEDKGTLILNWDAVDELFPQGLLNDMFQSFQRLLFELASDDAAWDRNLADNTRQLLPPEQWEIRRQANATEAPLSDELLHTPFLRQVAERPQDLAICAPQRRLTYLETYQRACRIERELLDRGVGPNQMVGVLMAKGWEQIVAVLGIHLAGGAYLPIDSELPPERQRYLIENGAVKIVLIQSELRSLVNVPEGIELLEVDAMEPLKSVPPVPRRRQTPEDLAYIIYTSGSTGQPKGVMIDHRGALNTVRDINQRFGVGPRDRVLALSRLNFDLSVYDIFGLLAAGGAIVIPSKELAQDPSHWTDLVAAEKVTIWNTVPALMQLMTEEMARQDGGGLGSTLRLIMMSGDWIPVNLPGQIQRALPEARIVSLGGATEASIWSILYPIDKVDPGWKSVPYGKPMLNQTFQVLNQALAPCPVWVPGNLYIGGIGIAKGYFGDAKKTNASFIQHPVTGERLYRTGDLGRYLPDGNIEFLGREDFQVKIQGYRIELGEIEVRLQEYPGVDNCAVIVREDGAGGKRLVGYVVPQEGAQLETGPVREYLRTKLPEYMIPSAIVYLDRFPLTANGKVDRKALPAPVREKKESGEEKSPSGDFLEARLIQLWEKVLGVQPVAADDNFFELGGTSIMAVRLFSELRKRFGKSLSLSTLFQAPTVEKIAELLRGSGYSSSWASLVPIQTKGDKPPFYCVHGAGGNVLMFRELAERMAAHGFPFYGLQARGLDGGQQYLKSVEEMATYYLKEIREFQPEGPYYLGGFCLGGQVAFEMAQTLRQQGEEVALLAVIDTYNFHGEKMVLSLGQSISHAGQKAAFHVQNILRLPVKQKVRYFLKKFLGFYIRESDRLILRLSNFFGIGQYKRTANSDGMLEYVNEEAHFAYVAAPYDGRTIIFKARKNYSYLHDPLLGWGEVITGPVEFVELPCNPGGLFMDPYVQSLADKLREEIDDSKIGYPSLESHLTFSRSGEKPEEAMGLVGAGSQASRGDYV